MKKLLSRRFAFVKDFVPPDISTAQMETKRAFDQKVLSGTYRFEECGCFCGKREGVLLSETDRYGAYYPILICRSCGLIRANPRLDYSSYSEFYNNEYRKLYGEGEDKKALWGEKVKQGVEVYEYITARLGKVGRTVYEVGCNMGATLYHFQKNGDTVAGVDFGRENIEYGKKVSNIERLFCGGIERLSELKANADLIILVHVFEHFLDLKSELLKIRGLLNPNGYLYVSVPGSLWWPKNVCNGNIMGLLQNAHTYQFTLTSLKYVMRVMGFEFVCGDESVRAIFRMKDEAAAMITPPRAEFMRLFLSLKLMEIKFAVSLWLKKKLKKYLSDVSYLVKRNCGGKGICRN
jgi:2-polyprenyl-3-methyl-5-hydroxy-6-metoxy-1,4-benzoquinol methylase